MDTPTEFPSRFVAGTTVKCLLTYDDFPASAGWGLKFALAGAGAMSVDASASGDSFAVTLSATGTAQLPAGLYRWSAQATKAGETYEAQAGSVIVTANPVAATGASQQGWDEQALAAVRAAIKGTLTSNLARFTILGRAVEHLTPQELRETEVWLAARIARRKPGAKVMRRIGIKFVNPGA